MLGTLEFTGSENWAALAPSIFSKRTTLNFLFLRNDMMLLVLPKMFAKNYLQVLNMSLFKKKRNCSHLQGAPVQLFNVVIYAANINILEDSFDFLMMVLLETLMFTFVDEKLASCHVSIVTISKITYQIL